MFASILAEYSVEHKLELKINQDQDQGESGILLRDIRSEIEGSQETLINNTTNQPRLPYITVKVPLDYRSWWPRMNFTVVARGKERSEEYLPPR